MKTLQGAADIFDFFRHNQTRLYFVNTTISNLMGANEWIDNLSFVNTIDSFDGQFPFIFAAPPPLDMALAGIEPSNNYLLANPAVADRFQRSGSGSQVLFLMFSEQTEALAKKLGLTVALPSAKVRDDLDNKMTTTRLADRAGIASVPNVLARIDSYHTLREVARGLGPDLVVQLAFGDSGATTFFISDENDYQRYADRIVAQPEVKVMKRIRCRQTTIEGCVTRHGTYVGPLMTEMIGFPELTPYGGGWCGNEVFGAGDSTFITPDMRQQAQQIVQRMGQQLKQEGFWGCFGLDLLVDIDSGALYLGEMNPRITGVSPLTTRATLDQQQPPLLLFHLLEFWGVDYQMDVDAFNQRWVSAEQTSGWSQLIMEHIGDEPAALTQVPRSGIWQIETDGGHRFSRPASQPATVIGDSEAFVLRTMDSGHTATRGSSIVRLTLRGRVITDDYQLTARAKGWIEGIRGTFGSNLTKIR